jgi:hypothetical protein
MTKQKAFTKEFEEEAVRLALTSGRLAARAGGESGRRAFDADAVDRPAP